MSLRKKMPSGWPSHRRWCRMVDLAVKLYRLDPALPEIEQLKQSPEQYGIPQYDELLRWLNPARDVNRSRKGPALEFEWWADSPLRLESLLGHYLPDVRFSRIDVDACGLHLFSDDRLQAIITNATLNPNRGRDIRAHRCYLVCMAIKELTGVRLQWELLCKTSSLVVEQHDGAWKTWIDQLDSAIRA